MMRSKCFAGLAAGLLAWSAASTASADPCGMVPPLWTGTGPPIERVGAQRTYVFYKDGMETVVLRPGFDGKVDEFGMLIPFPTPPAIRKVPDNVFEQVAAAVDPPEVVVDLRVRHLHSLGYADATAPSAPAGLYSRTAEEGVVVLKQEAVGMYEVAVLAAGSAQALEEWMDDHGFRYPTGMDATCEDYVAAGWCFVAVKTRVGHKAGSDPRPGMKSVDNALAAGEGFDGHVQGMGFRFRSDELVVPMRLSAFNEGELHNVVYVLADEAVRVREIDASLVRRQVSGKQLYENLTAPLPLRVVGGGIDDIPDWRRQSLPTERDPKPHNGIARELFAADLVAFDRGQLALPHEEREKELLNIGEKLGLRGEELDALHHDALEMEREAVLSGALHSLEHMTMTVIDGDFPREVLAATNLHFDPWKMPRTQNHRGIYDARENGAFGITNPFSGVDFGGGPPRGGLGATIGVALFLAGAIALWATRRRQPTLVRLDGRVAPIALLALTAAGALTLGGAAPAQEPEPAETPAPVPVELLPLFLPKLIRQDPTIVEKPLELPTFRVPHIDVTQEPCPRVAPGVTGGIRTEEDLWRQRMLDGSLDEGLEQELERIMQEQLLEQLEKQWLEDQPKIIPPVRFTPPLEIDPEFLNGQIPLVLLPPIELSIPAEVVVQDPAVELGGNLGENLVETGRIIVELTERGGAGERSILESLRSSDDRPLVKLWAAAGLIALADSGEELLPFSQECNAQSALERPLRLRWLELLADRERRPDLEVVLTAASQCWALQQKLVPALLDRKTGEFVRVLFQAGDQGARNLAASALATLAQDRPIEVAEAINEATQCRWRATQVPWEGGPLFLPSQVLTRDKAQELSGNLLAWMLWNDEKGNASFHSQLHNNLRSLGLANAAGYTSPGWQEASAKQWLLVWGEAMGRARTERLLKDVRVPRRSNVWKIVESLEYLPLDER